MLDKLRDRAIQILTQIDWCNLATSGPAGLQASLVRCAGRGTILYLLIPDTSDHLFNLESEPQVVVTTETWHLRGLAEIVPECSDLFSADQGRWHTVVRVTPIQLQILPTEYGAATYAETIDFDD